MLVILKYVDMQEHAKFIHSRLHRNQTAHALRALSPKDRSDASPNHPCARCILFHACHRYLFANKRHQREPTRMHEASSKTESNIPPTIRLSPRIPLPCRSCKQDVCRICKMDEEATRRQENGCKTGWLTEMGTRKRTFCHETRGCCNQVHPPRKQ